MVKRRMDPHPIEMLAFTKMWDDQLEFNNLFRENPSSSEREAVEQTKELVLHLHSETDEVLRACGAWKSHRREPNLSQNRRRLQLELVDVFKYWMSICQVHGFTPQEMFSGYWEKSMVVRQRYSEEFVQTLDHPAAVVDIDNVLADYITEFVRWAHEKAYISNTQFMSFTDNPRYVNAKSLNVPFARYEQMKHEFRVSGAHARLPLKPGARDFLSAIRRIGHHIILLTGRPIDRYPNLYSETLVWLQHWGLPYDMVWWSPNKGELCLTNGIEQRIAFAVDDEWQYVAQFSEAGIPVFWLSSSSNADFDALETPPGGAHTITRVKSLTELTRHITEDAAHHGL